MATDDPAPEFPAIFEVDTGQYHPLAQRNRFLVGRSRSANLRLQDPECAYKHFRIARHAAAFVLEALSRTTPTYCNERPVDRPLPLVHGSVIRAGGSRFRFLLRAEAESPITSVARAPELSSARRRDSFLSDSRTIVASGFSEQPPAIPADAFVLSGKMVIGRDRHRAQIVLAHPQVSRVHAELTARRGSALVADLGSANGTFVNGRRIASATVIRRGDRVGIGPYLLVYDGVALQPSSRANNVELVGRNLTRIVRDRNTGRPLTLLDDISLVIRPREFVCILGPSGSGKTTLMWALAARTPADKGSVTINGEDFYKNFDELKQDVAVVPQKDVLHDALSVRAALNYTARLRLPPDTSRQEREAGIREMLETVGLAERSRTRIRHLSGGQAKRASLANEIISKPSLLFLDEVTSGLDEQTDREMMRLFRQIADGGKTVVCITHSLANVERNCSLLVVLAPGGKLAFVGTPSEALQYFQIERLGDVYDRLMEKSPDDWKDAFRLDPLYCRYIDERLPAEGAIPQKALPRQRVTLGAKIRSFARQFGILSQRYLQIQLADWRSLVMMFGQCLLVAVLLTLLFGDISQKNLPERAHYSKMLLFLIGVSCLWFGCNNAAKEIVKERVIYARERDVNLLIPSYYSSKILLLGVWSLLQVFVLFGVVKVATGLPGPAAEQLAILSLTSLAGVTLGLLISAVADTDDLAITLVPIALIPQIVLANVIVPVDKIVKLIAQAVITNYWAFRGLATLLPDELTTLAGSADWHREEATALLAGHAAAFALGAVVVLLARDGSFRFMGGKALDRWLRRAAAK